MAHQHHQHVHLFVPWAVKAEEKAKFEPLFAELVTLTRKEKGCLRYDPFHHTKDPLEFLLIEEWESQADLDAHIKSEHFVRLAPQLGPMCSRAFVVTPITPHHV